MQLLSINCFFILYIYTCGAAYIRYCNVCIVCIEGWYRNIRKTRNICIIYKYKVACCAEIVYH